ncbi:MAG: DUF1326 domain-containing protein, partial [Gammaproteobacteria bacterium]
AQAITASSARGQQSGWSLAANIAECCSCEIPCPCNFGRPTELRCDGNRLIEIYDGEIEGASLSGIRFLVAFEMGKWTRIYIDEAMTQAQLDAYEAIMPLAFGGFRRGALAEERVPISVDRDGDVLSFSTPASEVEMKPLVGLDGGLIRIDGLPSNAFIDYIQYESVRHIHRNSDREWSYSGTNGFVSRMIASG